MMTFIFTLAMILASVAGLATGVLLGRAPLRGSCGGVTCVTGATCSACKAHRNAEGAP
jgi:hypothetical protein